MMNDTDRKAYIQRYEGRLREFGYSPQTLGWGKHGRQDVRFGVLADYVLQQPESSVLDVGCGFADLYDFLIQHGWHGAYTGIDIVPGLLDVARARHPDLDVRELDITDASATLERCDFVIASGILNAQLVAENNLIHIENILSAMHQHARVAVCVDFLGTYVDFQMPGSWHTDPAWVFNVAKRLSRRITLRYDYMPFEFALFIFCDDAISERNVFKAFEATSCTQ
jgi:SAM-dependent methyltransferase